MEFLTVWILSIVGIVILGVLIDVIICDGQMSKYIKSIFAVFSVVVIAAPVPALMNMDISVTDIFSGDMAIVLDENYLNYLNELKIQSVKDECYKIVASVGQEAESVEVEVKSESSEIFIKSIKIVIKVDKPHINIIEKIQKAICEKLSVSSEKVVIYGRSETA